MASRSLVWDRAQALYALYRRRQRLRTAEEAILAEEVRRLQSFARLQPEPISEASSPAFLQRIRQLDPFFLLTLGGPLYRKELLEIIRGVAINQHAGWSPDFKGSYTTDWAFYHRDLRRLGSTVHLTTTGADAGPILRRAHPCLLPSDTPETAFIRVVALGTELMVEVVREMIAHGEIPVFDQPPASGRTFLEAELGGGVLAAMARDASSGWLRMELDRLRRF